jgi:hypothetical protein
MRVIHSLLVPVFLSFTCVVQADLYSVSWYSPDCTDKEATMSIGKIIAATGKVLTAHGIPEVQGWKKSVNTERAGRELQADDTQGLRGLRSCNWRCAISSCKKYPLCFEMFNCGMCRRRELIGTDRVLTASELLALEEELVEACEDVLEKESEIGQGNDDNKGKGKYSDKCKAAMKDATCSALVTPE